jgi:hypothetical protein
MHCESDDSSGELVHLDHDRIGLKEDGFSREEVHAPKAVFGMAEEGEPGRTVRVGSRFEVMDKNPSDDIGFKVDVESVGDLLGDSGTSTSRITSLEFNNSCDDLSARVFRSWLPSFLRREQQFIFLFLQEIAKS